MRFAEEMLPATRLTDLAPRARGGGRPGGGGGRRGPHARRKSRREHAAPRLPAGVAAGAPSTKRSRKSWRRIEDDDDDFGFLNRELVTEEKTASGRDAAPQRTCVACRSTSGKRELRAHRADAVRRRRSGPDGQDGGPRGVPLHRLDCWQAASKRAGWQRAEDHDCDRERRRLAEFAAGLHVAVAAGVAVNEADPCGAG